MIMHLIIPLVVSLIINIIGFIVAFKKQSDQLTDGAYSFSFLVIAITALIEARTRNITFILSVIIVALWASRLGGYLVRRVIIKKKDRRFDDIRHNPFRFGLFWVTQGVTAWLLMLPILFETRHVYRLNTLAVIGLAIWAIGFITEALADYQKSRFNSKPRNKGHWIDEGLWHYSRHPNYFGEILVWCGVYMVCFSALNHTERYVSLISPIFISVLLLFISGVPPTEKSADKKWGDNPKYVAYKERTNLIIPFYNKF